MTSNTRDDLAQGVAITSSIHPDPQTHIEAVGYGKGQNSLFVQTVPMVDGGAFRALRLLVTILLHPLTFLRSQTRGPPPSAR